MDRMGRADLADQLLGHGFDIADRQVFVDCLERLLALGRHVDERDAIHHLLPIAQA